jgi:ornithine carbamoyltransferase
MHDTFVRAFSMKADPLKFSTALRGKTLAMIFEKPSLRTRVSFDVGMAQLGGHAIDLSPDISLGRREGLYDVAKNLERMVQAIMIRTFAHETLEQLAAYASIPIVNGLTDFSHPCQGMADYMTMLEVKGRLKGLRVAYLGDGNNVAHSLLFGAALLGVHIVIGCPEGFDPRPEVMTWCGARGAATGSTCRIVRDPREAARDADVVYTDVWASMGQEAEAAARREVFRPYQVNEALMAAAHRDATFMHCLPAHRGDEVTDGVIDSPQSVVFQQAENRLHVEKALLFGLMR